jgi:hypothetical protein
MMWRETVEKHHSALLAELGSQVEAELAQKIESAARQTVESLNQAMRRLRQVAAEAQTIQFLVDTCSPYARHLVVLVVEDNQFRVAGARGAGSFANDGVLERADVSAAAACADGKDPLTVLSSPAEIGSVLSDAMGQGSKVWLFPVVARSHTAAVVLASGDVSAATIELLSEAAGMRLEGQKAPVIRVESSKNWDDLSSDDQAKHRLAQRVARVRVAEIRLADAPKLQRAVYTGNIYSTFRDEIDRARDEFLKQHLSKTPSMVDYLHLEILRSLAHDEERLLGADYPGPMA